MFVFVFPWFFGLSGLRSQGIPTSFPGSFARSETIPLPGRGVLIILLGRGVPPGPENPYPLSAQNIWFSTPDFRPVSQNVYPLHWPCDVWQFRQLSITKYRTSWRSIPEQKRLKKEILFEVAHTNMAHYGSYPPLPLRDPLVHLPKTRFLAIWPPWTIRATLVTMEFAFQVEGREYVVEGGYCSEPHHEQSWPLPTRTVNPGKNRKR